MENKNVKFITGAIIGAAILVAAIIIAVVLPQMITTNQRALSLYDKANDLIHNIDSLEACYSAEAERTIKEAQDLNKVFVQKDTKEKIQNLANVISDFKLLDEAWNNIYCEKKYFNLENARVLVGSITNEEVKEHSMYKDLQQYIKLYDIKMKNKARTEELLNELVEEKYDDMVDRWSNEYDNIFPICGIARVSYCDYRGYYISLQTYDDEMYFLTFRTDSTDTTSWNKGIKELYDRIQENVEFEITAIVGGYPDSGNEYDVIGYNSYSSR